VAYERIPSHLQARVFGLTGAVGFAGVPLGGLLGGWAVQVLGLTSAMLVAGALYFAATLMPVAGYRTWRQIDRPPTGAPDPLSEPRTAVSSPG